MNLLPTAPDQPCGRRAPAASPPMRPSWLGAFLAIATFSLAGPVIAAELPDL